MSRCGCVLLCSLVVFSLSTACDDDRPSSASEGDLASDVRLDPVSFDLQPLDVGGDVGAEPDVASDGGPDGDASAAFVITTEPLTHACQRSAFYGGTLEVALSWSTSRPAICELSVSLAGGTPTSFAIGEEAPRRQHEFLHRLAAFDMWEQPPQPGDTVTWVASCEVGAGLSAVSPPMTLVLGEAERACIWPFDDGCSDASLVECNRALATCPPGLVPAVIDGCPRCVYRDTCSCDDGTEVICDMTPPECPESETAAVRDGCYACVDRWSCAEPGETFCPAYIEALADCANQLVTGLEGSECPEPVCLDAPCGGDMDCPMPAGGLEGGFLCVGGNCVDCWEDFHCWDGGVCRAGRCIGPASFECPPAAPCTREGCALLSLSEVPCPVCVCDSIFNVPCQTDEECVFISRFPYRHCVFGRCAQCRDDDCCDGGGPCLPPGICYGMDPHPEVLYGTWVIGWFGGLNHMSYFRFEPDGTLRRGRYEPGVADADDVPPLPCDPGTPVPAPLIGTWEPEVTASGFLVIRASLNLPCDDGEGWHARFGVTLSEDGTEATFDDIDSDVVVSGFKVPADRCTPDFSLCQAPSL